MQFGRIASSFGQGSFVLFGLSRRTLVFISIPFFMRKRQLFLGVGANNAPTALNQKWRRYD